MKTRIQKWGNSQGIRLAKTVLQEVDLSVGSEIEITVVDGTIVITPARRIRGRHRLEELLSRITEHHKAGEIDWGRPVGGEEW